MNWWLIESGTTNIWRERAKLVPGECERYRGRCMLEKRRSLIITYFQLHMCKVELRSQADSTYHGRKLTSLYYSHISSNSIIMLSILSLTLLYASQLCTHLQNVLCSLSFSPWQDTFTRGQLLPISCSNLWKAASGCLEQRSLPVSLRVSSLYL